MIINRSFVAASSVALLLAGAALFARSTPAATMHPAVAAGKSRFGRILFDDRGFALYAFTRDPARRVTCYGACGKAWPPFLVRARPEAGQGTRSSLVGTVRRKDGK